MVLAAGQFAAPAPTNVGQVPLPSTTTNDTVTLPMPVRVTKNVVWVRPAGNVSVAIPLAVVNDPSVAVTVQAVLRTLAGLRLKRSWDRLPPPAVTVTRLREPS